MREPRRVGHDRPDADAFTVRRLGDRAILRAVVIFAGEEGNEVIERKDAELMQRQRLFFTDSLDVSNVSR